MRGIALVTGASSGIGLVAVEALVAAGYRTIATARRQDRLSDLAGRLGEACHPLTLDVRDDASVAGLLDRLPAGLRAIDVLVNNAGHDVGGRTRFDEGKLYAWLAILDTNVQGMVRVCHAILPGMLARGRGHVVNIGSVVAAAGYAGGSLYAASKFAVRGFTESLRKDYVGRGIRVTEIAPGLVRTGFAAARWHGDTAKADTFYDAGKGALAPADIARAILFALDQPPEVTIAEMLILPSGDPISPTSTTRQGSVT